VADRTGHDRAPEQAIPLEAEQQVRDTLRRLGPDQPAPDAQRREIRLVAGALGELGGSFDQTLGVEGGADDGLWVQIDYGTLLLRDLSGREGCTRSGRHASHRHAYQD
jgi:hypothetical protein